MSTMLRDIACLCVFAKAPVPGEVKTRLLPYMDAEAACQLHQQLIEECLSRTVNNTSWQSQLWVTDSQHAFFLEMSKAYGIALFEQKGNDLGERMAHAMKSALQTYRHVVVIGTDCPELDAGYIERAVQYLQSGCDCVLGPAEDGGYVMLAVSKYDGSLFSHVEWGTSGVLETTRDRIRSLGWQCHEMPVLWDVDRPADYERWKRTDK